MFYSAWSKKQSFSWKVGVVCHDISLSEPGRTITCKTCFPFASKASSMMSSMTNSPERTVRPCAPSYGGGLDCARSTRPLLDAVLFRYLRFPARRVDRQGATRNPYCLPFPCRSSFSTPALDGSPYFIGYLIHSRDQVGA